MATLTNTKIKDTYDGLLKTADNDVIGASEKNITDGLGNATVLSIGTGSASFTSDIEVNGLTIGKGNGSITQNTAIGVQALFDNIDGQFNTAVGYNTLGANTSGDHNVAVGYLSLYNNTTGLRNVAIGTNSLSSNQSANDNIAIGYDSLNFNTTGANNSSLGSSSLFKNTTGSQNTAVGYLSLYNNTTGSQNTALGSNALQDNTTGQHNTAVGYTSLNNNIDGADNTAVGYSSLYTNTSGSQNVAIGRQALLSNTTGGSNTAIGYVSLAGNITGINNTAVGRASLYANTGSYNTALGAYSLLDNTTGSNNVAVGYNSLVENLTGLYNTAIGVSTLGDNTSGSGNVAVGYQALRINTASENTAVGKEALTYNTTGSRNVAVGKDALRNNVTANGNTAVGYESMLQNTSGAYNSAFGGDSLRSNLVGGFNSALGNSALRDNLTGDKNTAIGESALANNLSSDSNTAVGYRALYTSEGAYNTAIGSQSLDDNTTGGFNSAMGYNSLSNNTTGSYNISIGVNSLLSNADGDRNVAVGYAAGDSKTSGEDNIYIGYNADGSAATTSNEIVIGSTATGNGSNTATYGNASIVEHHFTAGDVYMNADLYGVEVIGNEFGATEYVDLTGNEIALGAGGSDRLVINSSGNTRITGNLTVDTNTLYVDAANNRVGINNNTPSSSLSVGQSFFVGENTVGNTSTAELGSPDTGGSQSVAKQLAFYTNAVDASRVERMRITSAGLVGINTDTPSWDLSVYKNSAANVGFALQNSTTGQTASDGLVLYVDSSGNSQIRNRENTYTAFWTNDAERLRIDSSGRVGIGKTPSSEKFEVNGAIVWEGALTASQTSAGVLDRSGDDLRVRVYGATAGSGNFVVRTGGGGGSADSEAMRIDSSGNVGIGTSSPASSAVTSGAVIVDLKGNAINRGGVVNFRTSDSSKIAWVGFDGGLAKFGTETSNDTVFYTANTERLRIDSSGRVGIGTSSPATNLDIASSSSTTLTVRNTGTVSSVLISNGSTANQIFSRGVNSSTGRDLAFVQGTTEAMRIDSSGNVLIGNTSASAKLDIRQDSGTAIRCEDASGGYFVVNQGGSVGIGTSSPSSPLHIKPNVDSIDGGITWESQDGTHEWSIDANNAGQFRIYKGTTSIARFDSSGNVGIGSNSPVSKLTLEGARNTNTITLRATDNDSGWSSGDEFGAIEFYSNDASGGGAGIKSAISCFTTSSSGSTSVLSFSTSSTGSNNQERMRLDTDGLKFNGDTAAANALDDYEEGTWIPAISFGGASVDVTYNEQSGQYTKVGRKVSISGRIFLSNKGTSTGDAVITGLPFTSGNLNSYASPASFRINNISFADFLQGNVRVNNTEIAISEVTNAGVISNINDANFVNTSDIYFSATYFV